MIMEVSISMEIEIMNSFAAKKCSIGKISIIKSGQKVLERTYGQR